MSWLSALSIYLSVYLWMWRITFLWTLSFQAQRDGRQCIWCQFAVLGSLFIFREIYVLSFVFLFVFLNVTTYLFHWHFYNGVKPRPLIAQVQSTYSISPQSRVESWLLRKPHWFGFPKASLCKYNLGCFIVWLILLYTVRPWLAFLAACGQLFLSASSQQALSKTTVTWMMILINYNRWLHWWTDNRQAVVFDYWEKCLPSFFLSCNTDLNFNLVEKWLK